jgi:hypothetical protein
MLQSAEYIIYFITEVRTIDTRLWQVRAITYPLTNMRIRIDGENGQVYQRCLLTQISILLHTFEIEYTCQMNK